MRFHHLLLAAVFALKVSCQAIDPPTLDHNHYRHVLERMWFFYAYQLEEFAPEASRTIGFNCRSWNRTTSECNGNWQQCQGTGNDNRCTYRELMYFFQRGEVNRRDSAMGLPLPGGIEGQAEPKPDITKTVQNIMDMDENHQKSYPPWKMARVNKGNAEYGAFVLDLHERMDQIYSGLTPEQQAEAKPFMDGLRDLDDRVIQARIIDHHHKGLIPLFKNHKDLQDITLKFDTHPDIPYKGANSLTLDFEATVNADPAKAQKTRALMEKIRDTFYKTDKDARLHENVLGTWSQGSRLLNGWFCEFWDF